MTMNRCIWANIDPLYIKYHDEEWGVPIHGDDLRLYEFLILAEMQSGLSQLMILQKRENLRKAFDQFDPEKIACYGEKDFSRLVTDAGIIRNQTKIKAAIDNARACLNIQEAFGSFDAYIWQFVGGQPIQNVWKTLGEIPLKSKESEAMSKDLLKRKFRLVSSTICYSFMQATGMVNDHMIDCFRHAEVTLDI